MKKQTIEQLESFLTERLEQKLGIKFVFHVRIAYVPAMNKWYAHIVNMPNIQWEYEMLDDARKYDESEKMIKSFVSQLKEYFANV